MSKMTLTVHCEYSETGQTLEKLIQSSFYTFLKRGCLSQLFAEMCSMPVAMNGRLSQEV